MVGRLGTAVRALAARYGKRLQLARLHQRHREQRAVEQDVDVASRACPAPPAPGPAAGTCSSSMPAMEASIAPGDVPRGADARGGVGQLAGVRLGLGDQLAQRLGRIGRLEQQHVGHGDQQADRLEALHRVVRQLHQADIDAVRSVRAEQHGVAVRLGPCHEVAADRGAGAGPVVHDDRLRPWTRPCSGRE